MSKAAQSTEIFDCSVEQFWKIITDYPSYADFLQEVSKCEVVESKGNKKLVEYTVSMMKTFKYKLWMDETKGPNQLKWYLDSGDLFKVSDGSWNLEAHGEKTKATYSVEAQFKVFVPGTISKLLVNVNMPNMMSSYKKRVKELYG